MVGSLSQGLWHCHLFSQQTSVTAEQVTWFLALSPRLGPGLRLTCHTPFREATTGNCAHRYNLRPLAPISLPCTDLPLPFCRLSGTLVDL